MHHWAVDVVSPSKKTETFRAYMKGTKDSVLDYFHDMGYNTYNRSYDSFKLLPNTLRIEDRVAEDNDPELVDESARNPEYVELETTGLSEDFITPNDLERIGQDAYKHNRDGWKDDNIVAIVNGKVIDCNIVKYIRPEGYPSNGTFFLLDGTKASLDAYENEKKIMLSEKEEN